MFKLTLAEQTYECQENETVLEALVREKVDISYICKVGSCQTCLIRSVNCAPPAAAQTGLKDTQKTQHYFLACRCHPEQDMTLKLPDQSAFYTEGTVAAHQMLNRNTLLLRINFKDAFEFHPGQFVNLQRFDGLTRSYSIANIPHEANSLEFHIRRLSGGIFSEWLHTKVNVGDAIMVSEPRGHCFYLPDRREQGLLLIGTGSGLAPLEGILMTALKAGHSGAIYLFHGAREKEDLYRIEEMRKLAAEYPNFFYTPCVSGSPVSDGFTQGRANEVAMSVLPDLKNWRVFLCGHPEMVNQSKWQLFMKGASMSDIYADAFVLSHPTAE